MATNSSRDLTLAPDTIVLIPQLLTPRLPSSLGLKLLWIPHKDWPSLDGQRERWLLDSWPDSEDELHILSWQPARGYGKPFSSFGWSNFRQGRITVHSRPRIPNVIGPHALGRFGKDRPRGLWANEQLFRFYTRQLVRNLGIDVLLYGLGHKAVGLPPFELPVTRVFDCLDLIIYPDIEAAYITHSHLVLCTSRVLVDRLQKFGKEGVYIPNGVSRRRVALGQRERTRAKLGLRGKRVVSLIGLTSSPSLFFVDALARAAAQISDIVFLVVGGGDLLRPLIARCRQLGLPFVATGPVPNKEIANYFAATDVGLYAGDASPYFHAACPIKVLEYTAARRPVVATDLEELRRIGFPNVRLSAPDPERFALAIVASFREPTEFADLSGFEWAALAQNLRKTLWKLVKERHQ